MTMSEKRRDGFTQILSAQQKKLIWDDYLFSFFTIKIKSHANGRGKLRSLVAAAFTL